MRGWDSATGAIINAVVVCHLSARCWGCPGAAGRRVGATPAQHHAQPLLHATMVVCCDATLQQRRSANETPMKRSYTLLHAGQGLRHLQSVSQPWGAASSSAVSIDCAGRTRLAMASYSAVHRRNRAHTTPSPSCCYTANLHTTDGGSDLQGI